MTPTRSVKFADEVDSQLDTIVEIETLRGLHHKERQQRWYSRDELNEQQAADQQGEHDTRGLERQSDDVDLQRSTATLDVIRAVLEEQHRQRTQADKDLQKLADICSELSAACRKTARKVGKQDAACIPEAAEMDAERKRRRCLAKKEKEARLQAEAITKTIGGGRSLSPSRSKQVGQTTRRPPVGAQGVLGRTHSRRQ